MKTRRRQNKRRVGKTKRGGLFNFFGKKPEPPTQVRDWDGEIEIPPVESKPFMEKPAAVAQYDPCDPLEKQRIIDAYAKVGVEHKKEIDEHKKEIDTNDQTTKDLKEILMDYTANPSCLEYDSYVQERANDPNLKNYKKVLDKKINNLSQNPQMKLFANDVKGIQKCSSFFRNPFRTTKAEIARQGLMKVGEQQEREWASAATAAAGGKRKSRKNRKTKRNRKSRKH